MDNNSNTQQYNLKWTNFTANLLQIFAEQLNREILTDVNISCEGNLIKAHRIVLSACSTYFQNLFEVFTVPNPLIILSGVKLEDLKQVLTFMYQGEIKVYEKNIDGVLKLANELEVKGLSNVNYGNIIEQKNSAKKDSPNEASPINFQPRISQSNQLPINNLSDTVRKPEVSINKADNCLKKTETSIAPLEVQHLNSDLRQSESPSLSIDSNASDYLRVCRPPNAFMLFISEKREKVTAKFPNDTNKEISVRLSAMWKRMPASQKVKYYYKAKKNLDSTSQRLHNYNVLAGVKRRKEEQIKTRPLNEHVSTQKDEDSLSNDTSDGLEIIEDDVEFIEVKEERIQPAPNEANGDTKLDQREGMDT